MRVFSNLWATYQRYLSTNPWRTQTMTTGMIMSRLVLVSRNDIFFIVAKPPCCISDRVNRLYGNVIPVIVIIQDI